MMIKQAPLLPFLALLLVSFGACRSFKQPELKAIENVKAPTLGFKNTIVTLDLHFYNPNKFLPKFKEYDFYLLFNNEFEEGNKLEPLDEPSLFY